jgi:outer membrane murein-binding lipoprotein Lpp
MLINKILKLPSKISEQQLRFLCPICSQFNTATKRETNLARCFRCKRNFNTIEMVMAAKNLDFIKSAQFLQALLAESNLKENIRKKPLTNTQVQRCTSVQIPKDSLAMDTLTKKMGIAKTKKLNGNSNNDLAKINQREPVIGELNDKIDRLSKQLDQLKSFVIDQFIEKSKNS